MFSEPQLWPFGDVFELPESTWQELGQQRARWYKLGWREPEGQPVVYELRVDGDDGWPGMCIGTIEQTGAGWQAVSGEQLGVFEYAQKRQAMAVVVVKAIEIWSTPG